MKKQKILEHYEIFNQLKLEWDSLTVQHHRLAQRFVPIHIEVSEVTTCFTHAYMFILNQTIVDDTLFL